MVLTPNSRSCRRARRHVSSRGRRLIPFTHLYIKTLEAFDFGFQPSIDRKKIHELAAGTYLERTDKVVFLGPPGTGKTHLAVALGLKAAQQGCRPLFMSAGSLMAALAKAYSPNRFEEKLKRHTVPRR